MGEMRVLSIDEGSFSKQEQSQALLVGCLLHDNRIAKVTLTSVTIDGRDATKRVLKIARSGPHPDLILIGSISIAGFNIIDPYLVNSVLGTPLLVVNKERPRLLCVEIALRKHFKDWRDRLKVFRRMGSPKRLRLSRRGVLYYYAVGIDTKRGSELLSRLAVLGSTPEPLRVARILARTLSGAPSLQTSRRMRQKRGNQRVI